MNKKNLIKNMGIAALVIGIPTLVITLDMKREKRKQEIIRNPSGFLDYTVQPSDGIDRLIRKYSNKPDGLDIRDVRDYVMELNGKRKASLYIGEDLKLPVYEIRDKEKR